MRSRSYIFIIVIIIGVLFNNINTQGKALEIFDNIIQLTNGSIEEVGIRLSFNVEDSGEKSLKKVYSALNVEDIDIVESSSFLYPSASKHSLLQYGMIIALIKDSSLFIRLYKR